MAGLEEQEEKEEGLEASVTALIMSSMTASTVQGSQTAVEL
jgi:hypothetical protein